MIRAVLDTNIFLSGFLFKGKQRQILDYALEGKIRIYISEEILSEISKVLKRPKFSLHENQSRFFLNEIESLCEMCYPSEAIKNICRDAKDHIILECAVESETEYIITGDNDLLSLKKYRNIMIINSDDFLNNINL